MRNRQMNPFSPSLVSFNKHILARNKKNLFSHQKDPSFNANFMSIVLDYFKDYL